MHALAVTQFLSLSYSSRIFFLDDIVSVMFVDASPSGRAVSPAEIMGSNPTGGMDGCLLWLLCVVR